MKKKEEFQVYPLKTSKLRISPYNIRYVICIPSKFQKFTILPNLSSFLLKRAKKHVQSSN